MRLSIKNIDGELINMASKYLIGSILLVMLITFIGPIIILNESQILYAFSASAQVVAGLYGLTLTGYIFYHSKLEQKVVDDDTLEDQIEKIKIESYENQIIVGIMSLISIAMSLITIFIYNNGILPHKFIDFIINFSSIIFFLNISMIIFLSLIAINPNRIEDLSNKIKKEIEKNYDGNEMIDDDGKSYGKFMVCFNKLNKLMENYANELEQKRPVTFKNGTRRNESISELARVLNVNEIIAGRDVELIDMFRKYRNATAHGTEMKIDKKILEKIELYYKCFVELYNARENIEERNAAYSKLSELVFE